jgi:hypothetical protein
MNGEGDAPNRMRGDAVIALSELEAECVLCTVEMGVTSLFRGGTNRL